LEREQREQAAQVFEWEQREQAARVFEREQRVGHSFY
jgi:hypothetical protein